MDIVLKVPNEMSFIFKAQVVLFGMEKKGYIAEGDIDFVIEEVNRFFTIKTGVNPQMRKQDLKLNYFDELVYTPRFTPTAIAVNISYHITFSCENKIFYDDKYIGWFEGDYYYTIGKRILADNELKSRLISMRDTIFDDKAFDRYLKEIEKYFASNENYHKSAGLVYGLRGTLNFLERNENAR